MDSDLNAKIKEQIAFEKLLFNNPPNFEYREIQNKGFLINLFGIFPKLRPHYLESFVLFCSHYLKEETFRKNFLKNTFHVCPTLIERLYRIKCINTDEIKELLDFNRSKYLCLFFKNEIEVDYNSFNNDQYINEYSNSVDTYSLNNLEENELDFLIQFGFPQSSIELCLKYDISEDLGNMMMNQNQKLCKWSPFEWSKKPISLDFYSFCGFYGSLKCFKVLLLSGSAINNDVINCIACSGSKELFNLVLNFNINSSIIRNGEPLHYAAQYGHLSVIEYLVNQKADINAKTKDVMF